MNSLFSLSVKLTVLVACFTMISFSSGAQSMANENVMLYNGNAFYWSDSRMDTVKEVDAETGETVWKIIMTEAVFKKMNEEPIYNSSDKGIVEPVFKYGHQTEAQYFKTLFKSKTEFLGMPSFWIEKMVINKVGKPVYFEIRYDDAQNAKALKNKWGLSIEKSIKNMPYWEPAQYKGKPVLFYLITPLHIESTDKSD